MVCSSPIASSIYGMPKKRSVLPTMAADFSPTPPAAFRESAFVLLRPKPPRIMSGPTAGPPCTPKVVEFVAVQKDDGGLADAAAACSENLRWICKGRTTAMSRDWQAYQNLLQLAGILKTAGLGNARQVWDHIVEFVELHDMAQTEPPVTKLRVGPFKTAHEMFLSPLGSDQQSPAPASVASEAEPCAGVLPQGSRPKPSLSPAQLEEIHRKREEALAIKHSRAQREPGEAAPAAAASDLPPEL